MIAVAPERRDLLISTVLAHELSLHIDVIGGTYAGQRGVGPGELHQLAESDPDHLDVHFMVDDPAAHLPSLPRRVAQIDLQCSSRQPGLAELVEHARRCAQRVWLVVDTAETHIDWVRLSRLPIDGVLVMLTPPGQPGHVADLRRLATVRSACRHGLRAGVDGGVTLANFDQVAAAGARHVVVGRGLVTGNVADSVL
nr:hypothetical protein [Allobranchiibius huperziae]